MKHTILMSLILIITIFPARAKGKSNNDRNKNVPNLEFKKNRQLDNSPSKIEAFKMMLREFDLNQETENGFAITQAEYFKLQQAWLDLRPPDKNHSLLDMASKDWQGTFILKLLYDLNNEKSWDVHIKTMEKMRVRGLSLTLSRLKTPRTLEIARQTLTDLLFNGENMFNEGQLTISKDIKKEASKRAGNKAAQRLEKWEQLINKNQNKSDLDKITKVNEFFNKKIAAKADVGTSEGCDYWQSPIETLVRGIGDCDDFAIAKYVSLRLLGFFPKELRVAVLKSKYGTCHAVLLVYFKSENNPLVLDNETFEYSGLIDSHILRLKYRMSLHKMRPIYSLNEDFWAIFKRGLNEEIADSDPLRQFPKFNTALINSKRVLPNNKG